MKLIAKFSSLFTSLIAVFIVSNIERPYDNHQSLPFYQTPWITWEERVFERSLKNLQKHGSLYEKSLKNKITQLISGYKTGLQKGHLDNLPDQIIHESKKYGYDPLFLAAVIITESSFNNWARSNKGALGLMQIRPATGKELASETHIKWEGQPTLFDPITNIALGAYYLNKLVLRFDDLGLALEAYNHGPSKLNRYLRKGYQPKRYSQKVFLNYNWLRFPSV